MAEHPKEQHNNVKVWISVDMEQGRPGNPAYAFGQAGGR